MKQSTQSTKGKPTVSESVANFSFGSGSVVGQCEVCEQRDLTFDVLVIARENRPRL